MVFIFCNWLYIVRNVCLHKTVFLSFCFPCLETLDYIENLRIGFKRINNRWICRAWKGIPMKFEGLSCIAFICGQGEGSPAVILIFLLYFTSIIVD